MSSLRATWAPLCFAAFLAGAAGLAAAPQRSPAPPSATRPATEAEAFFETRVRPVLVRRCNSCHALDPPAGGLAFSTRAALLKGGKRGPALLPGKPEESLLLRAVSHADPALKMPPAARIPAQEIEALRVWIAAGADWPDGSKGKGQGAGSPESATHWAFRPVREPKVPAVAGEWTSGRVDEWTSGRTKPSSARPLVHSSTRPLSPRTWIRNPIDAFILERQVKAGLTPAPEADRRTLIRRLTFDLTGLPPAPDEVDAFLADRRADAYEQLVERLLASPHYGERWGRYWLDLVRYADSNGYERDAEKPHSWKYRDYVIASFNEDKRFDRFVAEQLAGDELPDRSEATVTATGFLRLGTWDDEPNDALEYQYERLDDLVHATSTAFLGLTVRCARCHDHKYDPIPQTDYYAIGAAFWGGYVQPGDGKLLGGPPPERLGFPVLGFTEAGPTPPELRLLSNGDPRREGPAVEPGFLSVLSSLRRRISPPPAGSATSHRRRHLASWITDPRNPLTPRVLVNRLWQHHFGEGLVRTPNNFGLKGSPPTHPELLDWLAALFAKGSDGAGDRSDGAVESWSNVDPARSRLSLPGSASPLLRYSITPSLRHSTAPSAPRPWSLKSLHRLIVMSSTYRMASLHPREAAFARKDAANTLWWRFNRRRLDADALRDALLAVSGELNRTVGGRGFTPAVGREALEGLSRKGAEWVVSPPEEQRRRSVYMFLKRSLIMPFMTVFDFGDTNQPVEQRESSIVATQALALMNNTFPHEQSQALAARARREAGDDPGLQVDRLWRLALQRLPEPEERAAALRHLSGAGTNRLGSLAHVLLNTNEFLFVD